MSKSLWGQPEDNFILYMDVLGGESIIDSPHVVKLSTFIKWAIDETKRVNLIYNNMEDEESKIYFKMFSDNIIICSKANYKFLLQIAAGWQRKLSDLGIFLRGALCYGSIIKEDDFVLGSGLVKAYKLESNVAIYPRIIIDESFSDKTGTDFLEAYATKFCDDLLFVDYLCLASNELYKSEVTPFFMNHGGAIKNNLFYSNYVTQFTAQQIERGIREKIIRKHEWLRDYYNHFLRNSKIDFIKDQNGNNVDCLKYFGIDEDIAKWRDSHLWHLQVNLKYLPLDFVVPWRV